MSAEAAETNEKSLEEQSEDMRTENAGSTPLPRETQNTENDDVDIAVNEQEESKGATESLETVAIDAPPTSVTREGETEGYNPTQQQPRTEVSQQHQLPLSINQFAIVASAQNKLPVDKVKSIVLRLGRHTESSVQKTGKWFKNENYVDKDSYSWKNMSLFEDHQCHLWTREGTVRSSFKK